MKIVPLIVGALGLVAIVLAFIGRFHAAQTITVGQTHVAASSVLLVGNSLLLIGLFLSVLNLQNKPQPPQP